MNERVCPVCEQVLSQSVHESVQIDQCALGHGIWLDLGELREVVASEQEARSEGERVSAYEQAVKQNVKDIVSESASGPRSCPVCRRAMKLTEYANSGIPIDECNEHGVWLDAGELERIEAYAEGMRDRSRLSAGKVDAQPIRGVDIPASLLATITSRALPPRLS